MRTKNLRLLVPAAALAALVLPAAPPAFADPDDFAFDLPAGLGCDFALGVTGTGGNLHTKDFLDENGDVVRSIKAGKGVLLTYTNLDTGEAVTIRTDGSVSRTTTNADGTQTVVLTGHNGLILFPSDVPAGPTTTQYVGRVVYDVDPATGVFTLVSTKGPARDICAELS